MKRLLLLMLIFSAGIAFGQTKGLQKKQAVGPAGPSGAGGSGEAFVTVADTIALKLVDTTDICYLAALGPSSIGGSVMVKVDSTYPEGVVAFNHPTTGQQWVRAEFKADPTTVRAEWAGNRTQVALDVFQLPSGSGDNGAGAATVKVICGGYTDSTIAFNFTPIGLPIQGVVWIRRSNVRLVGNGTKLVVQQHTGEVGGPGVDGSAGTCILVHRDVGGIELKNITIEGFDLDGQGRYQAESGGGWATTLIARYARNLTVKDNTISNPYGSGMEATGVTNFEFSGNRVRHGNFNPTGGNGISITYGNMISGPVLNGEYWNPLHSPSPTDSGGTDTTYDDRGMGIRIINNDITDFNLGIDIALSGTSNIVVSGNTLTKNDIGIDIEVLPNTFGRPSNVTITGNTIKDGSGRGKGNKGIGLNSFVQDTTRLHGTVVISSNVIHNAGGVWGNGACNNLNISDNVITQDKNARAYSDGIHIGGIDPFAFPPRNLAIHHNIITINITDTSKLGVDGIPGMIFLGAYSASDSMKRVVVDHNIITNESSTGIDSAITSFNGIVINAGPRGAHIEKNQIKGFGVGITHYAADQTFYTGNTISDSWREGMQFRTATNAGHIFDHNFIFNNGRKVSAPSTERSGMAFLFGTYDSMKFTNNEIYDNQATATQRYGIYWSSPPVLTFLDNVVKGDSVDIFGGLKSVWEYRHGGAYKHKSSDVERIRTDSILIGGDHWIPEITQALPTLSGVDFILKLEADYTIPIYGGDLYRWPDSSQEGIDSSRFVLLDTGGGTPTVVENSTGLHPAIVATGTDGIGTLVKPGGGGLVADTVLATHWTVSAICRATISTQQYLLASPQFGGSYWSINTSDLNKIGFNGVASSVMATPTSEWALYTWTKSSGDTVYMYQNNVLVGQGAVASTADTIKFVVYNFSGTIGMDVAAIMASSTPADQDTIYQYLYRKYFVNGPTLKASKVFIHGIELDPMGAVTNDGLKYNGTKFVPGTFSGGSGTLGGLTDVDTTGKVNGSVIKYNTGTGKWEVGSDNAGGGGFSWSINGSASAGDSARYYAVNPFLKLTKTANALGFEYDTTYANAPTMAKMIAALLAKQDTTDHETRTHTAAAFLKNADSTDKATRTYVAAQLLGYLSNADSTDRATRTYVTSKLLGYLSNADSTDKATRTYVTSKLLGYLSNADSTDRATRTYVTTKLLGYLSNADSTDRATRTYVTTKLLGFLSNADSTDRSTRTYTDAKVADAINDGTTTVAPSQNAVFDALAGKQAADADLTTWAGITPGTGVGTALGVNVGSAGAFVVNGGALGTPSSGTATNLSGTAASLTAGTVTTNANLTGPVTSSGNATTITDTAVTLAKMANMATASLIGRNTAGTGVPEVLSASTVKTLLSLSNVTDESKATMFTSPTFTGTPVIPTPFTLGAISVTSTGTQLNYLSSATGTTGTASTNLVFSTSPVLTTPTLGVATATSINGNIFTTGTYTLTGVAAKTLTFNKTLTLDGTDGTTITFPSTSATMARTDAVNTFTGVQAMTSPAITTSVTTPSTTFALYNTTATTVNAFGAATTLNFGASATQILNFGGSTTASEFRFLEPSGSGTNYSAFKAVAQAANITYSLPPAVGAAGTYLRDVAGDGVLTWAAASGSSSWTDADPMMQTVTTRDVAIGAAQINSAKLSIDGDADQVQLSIQSHSTQTSDVVVIENSSGTDLVNITNTGAATFAGNVTAPNILSMSGLHPLHFTPWQAEFPSTNFPELTTTHATARRPVLGFDATTDQNCYWTIPYAPSWFASGTITATISFVCASDNNTAHSAYFTVALEAITSADATDLDAAESFDTANSGNTTILGTVGYMKQINITLTNKDAVATGDYVRIKLTTVDASADVTGDIQVLGVSIQP